MYSSFLSCCPETKSKGMPGFPLWNEYSPLSECQVRLMRKYLMRVPSGTELGWYHVGFPFVPRYILLGRRVFLYLLLNITT